MRWLAGHVSPAEVPRQRGSAGFDSGYFLRLSRTAMACRFEVFLHPEDRVYLPSVQEALDEVDRLEDQLSVYRPDSELSDINRRAAAADVTVDPELYALLREAEAVGRATGSAFDITTGPLVRCWGFLERRGRVPEERELLEALACTGWQNLQWDDARSSLRFLRSGVELNLGAIGKGYALDRVARRLRRDGLRNFLIHAGHSSVLASGRSPNGEGWEVSVRNPEQGSEMPLCSVRMTDQAMSVSGTREQHIVSGGRRLGHILDPRTGRPAEQHRLCVVLAPTAARAEALSTAFFVMATEEVRDYVSRNREIGTILVAEAEGGLQAPIVLGNLEEERQEQTA